MAPAQAAYRAVAAAAKDILAKRYSSSSNFDNDFHRTHTIISTGAIIGIVLAVLAFIVGVCVICCVCTRSRRNHRRIAAVDNNNYGYGPGYQKEADNRYSHSTVGTGGGGYQYGAGVTGVPPAYTANHHHHHDAGAFAGGHVGGHHGGGHHA